jgi:hypothetical protein
LEKEFMTVVTAASANKLFTLSGLLKVETLEILDDNQCSDKEQKQFLKWADKCTAGSTVEFSNEVLIICEYSGGE